MMNGRVATGIISGLVGIGGGVLVVPILLYVFKVDMHSAAGTSLAIIIPTAIVGALSHFTRGTNIDWRVAAIIALGAIAGATMGAWIANALPAVTLKKVFAVILLVVSISILLDSYGIRITGSRHRAEQVASQGAVQGPIKLGE